MSSEHKPHSADYFGESRDFWWNLDFMQLMAKRLDLDSVHKVLDVGCGIGHWSRVIAAVLPIDSQIYGIDLEGEWIAQATQLAQKHGLGDRCHYQVGNALNIDYPDNMFDMVTCQTLLIHLQNPSDALKEFIRILKPNGILLIAEPSSVPLYLWANNIIPPLNTDTFIQIIRFQRVCETGKAILGEGWISAGEFIPGYLAKLNVKDIQVYLSDKCNPSFPPYNASSEQESIVSSMQEHSESELWIWDKETTKRYFTAGMLQENPSMTAATLDIEFANNWKLSKQIDKSIFEGLKSNQFSTAGGHVMYLTCARKK